MATSHILEMVLAALMLVCVDVMVMSCSLDMT